MRKTTLSRLHRFLAKQETLFEESGIDEVMTLYPEVDDRLTILEAQNNDGNTALHLTLINHSMSRFRTLLSYCYRIDPQALISLFSTVKNTNGESIIELILKMDDFSVLEDLLAVLPNHDSRKETLRPCDQKHLHGLAMAGDIDRIQRILGSSDGHEVGRLLNDTSDSYDSRRPIDVAQEYSQKKVVRYLEGSLFSHEMKARAEKNSSPFKVVPHHDDTKRRRLN